MEMEALAHPGRPRDPRLDEALTNAALEVFLERGYQATTFSEISRRAGVGTPAIYRRWPTKAALAIDVYERSQGQEPIPDSGSIREDLIQFMRFRIRGWRTRLFHQLVLPLLMEGLVERTVAGSIANRFREYRKPLAERIQRSIDRGELRPTDPNRLLNFLFGTVIIPLLYDQELPLESDAEAIVDEMLIGLATKPT